MGREVLFSARHRALHGEGVRTEEDIQHGTTARFMMATDGGPQEWMTLTRLSQSHWKMSNQQSIQQYIRCPQGQFSL